MTANKLTQKAKNRTFSHRFCTKMHFKINIKIQSGWN